MSDFLSSIRLATLCGLAAAALAADGASPPATQDALTGLAAWIALPAASRPAEAPALTRPLSRAEAVRAVAMLLADRTARVRDERSAEVDQRALVDGAKTMRWLDRTLGEAPVRGHSLWISMHGGGSTTPDVNDQQWRNQLGLYTPAEGIYLAPRAPTDAWNMWHESSIDALFSRLIDDLVAVRGVDPDRVYLMGYSAGGDGVWKLAPRMADRFAAAAMMAGHPNDAPLASLRNLPFAAFVGADDAAFGRNRVVAARGAELDRLAQADPGSYDHLVRVYPGLGHWMNRLDAEAVPWMAARTRRPWPRTVIWVQDGTVHDRFYWLALATSDAGRLGQRVTASVTDHTITIAGDVPRGLTLALSDELLDLDQPVTVAVAGKAPLVVAVARTAGAIVRSLAQRLDGPGAAVAWLAVDGER